MEGSSGRPKRGRPSAKDEYLWEIETAGLEVREIIERIGPALRRLQRCSDHQRETSSIASGLMRLRRQSYSRRL